MVFQSAAEWLDFSTKVRGWHLVQRSWSNVAPLAEDVDADIVVVVGVAVEQADTKSIKTSKPKIGVTQRFLIVPP